MNEKNICKKRTKEETQKEKKNIKGKYISKILIIVSINFIVIN